MIHVGEALHTTAELLATEQRALDTAAARQNAGAGVGKTFALDAARAAWQSAGHQVIGTTLAARAAAELQDGSGIPSGTLHGLLDHFRRGLELNSRMVVVVDEAGMVGTGNPRG